MISERKSHVPFMVISPAISQKHFKHLKMLGSSLTKLFPNLKKDLREAYINTTTDFFIISAILSSFLFSIISFVLLYAVSIAQEHTLEKTIMLSFSSAFAIWVLIFFIYIKYPSILAKKISEDINKHLVFALKDLLLHTASGASIFDSLLSVSEAGYGTISEEFEKVVREINTGKPTHLALEHLAKRTESHFLKKVIWQLINTIKSGGNLKISLDNIVADLTQAQRSNIVNYANELNLWSLIYMLFAVAAPTIGMTMMIILSSFADIGVNQTTLMLFIGVTLVIQIVIIGLIKSRRPAVEF